MKHLVTLAFRYLRRQKLRTLLTFMCISLSVFLICSVAAYLSSGINSLKKNESGYYGTWQVDMSGIVNSSDSPQDTIRTIREHISVSDSISGRNEVYGDMADECDDVCYINVTFDGHTEAIDLLEKSSVKGNLELYDFDMMNSGDYDGYVGLNEQNDASLAYIPSRFRDEYGYKVGDRITFTFTPVSGKVDMDDEKVQAVLADRELYNDEYINEETDSEKRRTMAALNKKYALSEIPMKELSFGAAYTAELKIAGFNDDDMTYYYSTYDFFSRRIMQFYVPENSVLDLSELNRLNPGFREQNGEEAYNSDYLCFIRTNDAIDFDDAMNRLVRDLGYDEDYDIVLGESEGIAGVPIHDDLLRWEFRRAGNISQYIGFISFMLLMIVIAWLLCRFIIDNAFNISVQERSVQFATLRIMGTSKAQIAALVLTEGLFYTVTAVPIGALSAFAICRYVFDTLGSLGNMGFEYSLMKPFAFAGIGLCVLAIFISALTSALWASRRLSPAEAMNYGKPRLRSRRLNRKSKLDRSSVGFLMNYTKRNLRTHISQNVVATVSLSLGVMMLLSCLFIGVIIKKEREGFVFDNYDYQLQLLNDDARTNAHETFDNNRLFTDVRYRGECYVDYNDGHDIYMINFYDIKREDYEMYVEADTGISYDTFRDEHYALLSSYGGDFYGSDVYDGTVSDITDSDKTFSFHVIGSLDGNERYGAPGIYVAEENFIADVVDSPSAMYYLFVNMKVNGAEKHDKAQAAVNDFAKENHANLEDVYIECTGFRSLIRAGVIMVGSFIFSVWLAGVFAMISIVNTSVLNRKRELAMMRAVGMTKRQLYGTVIYESVRFSAVSTVIGVILGVAFSALGAELIHMGELSSIASVIALSALVTVVLNTVVAAAASIPALSSLRKNLKAEQ